MPIPLPAIREAAERVAPHLHRTPVLSSRSLGERAGVSLWLKAESLQKTGSFKPRGALNVVLTLPEDRRARGLITVSAGNHAQAVAWVARIVNVPCTVVMPAHAPRAKKAAVEGYGAKVILHDDLATIFDRMREEEARTGAAFVHPFDDPHGLAGAGTLGLELVEQCPELDALFVAIGGGGLMTGVTCAVKALRPRTRIFGVDLAEGPGMGPALAAGKPVPVKRPKTLADGLAAPFVGAIPLEAARKHLEAIVLVSEEQIADAMRALFERARLVAEGAGAAALAGLFTGQVKLERGAKVAVIVSGANVDPERFAGLYVGANARPTDANAPA